MLTNPRSAGAKNERRIRKPRPGLPVIPAEGAGHVARELKEYSDNDEEGHGLEQERWWSTLQRAATAAKKKATGKAKTGQAARPGRVLRKKQKRRAGSGGSRRALSVRAVAMKPSR